ncbi:Gfo/Idh/MocA family oxidoreductase [Microbacterium protaetiae]|uniref:Gfo/Idh/MocA family oxidoreductase n=1 Tax=Microbacterium protaetiae TaxID=2509458 RepID=A0A4V0YD10_9MICO|nr:Gfo/Idh/MocA family oxidoreductase [Microbacterium protaetiae]QAY59081.1 Gfo/Idh/MocA family oxidoreductase [Microbacterium protaetiae]
MNAPRLAVIGTGGHGGKHLARAVRLHEEGRVRLVAVGDPNPPGPELIPADTRCHPDGLSLLAAEDVDVVIVSTPIHTHFSIAAAAVRAGADVLLEKPTTATLTEYDELVALTAAHRARVQIGFQSLGCAAVDVVRRRIAEGVIGEVMRFSATGAWVRDERYWARARWAGRRTLDGVVVADGVLTNPLAHATATALALSGATGRDAIAEIELDLHRANPIEADDTSVAILRLTDGRRLTTAVTLAAAATHEPFVEVVGESGTLRLYYKTGKLVTLDVHGTVRDEQTFGFGDLLDDLLSARANGHPLFAPIEQTGAFMRLVDAVVRAPVPRAIAPEHIERHDDAAGVHLVVRGVEAAIDRALRAQKTFTALGVPFAAPVAAAR